MEHRAEPTGMRGLPVLDETGGIGPGDIIAETVWGKSYEVVENPSDDKLEILAESAGIRPEDVCFTVKGHGRDFAYHKPVYWRNRTTYFKTEGHQ